MSLMGSAFIAENWKQPTEVQNQKRDENPATISKMPSNRSNDVKKNQKHCYDLA